MIEFVGASWMKNQTMAKPSEDRLRTSTSPIAMSAARNAALPTAPAVQTPLDGRSGSMLS